MATDGQETGGRVGVRCKGDLVGGGAVACIKGAGRQAR